MERINMLLMWIHSHSDTVADVGFCKRGVFLNQEGEQLQGPNLSIQDIDLTTIHFQCIPVTWKVNFVILIN